MFKKLSICDLNTNKYLLKEILYSVAVCVTAVVLCVSFAQNLKVHKHEIFFAETETLWSQGPVTRDF